MDDAGFTIERRGRSEAAVVLALAGEFDLAAQGPLTERLRECIDAGCDVEVDMAGVTFLESIAIAALVAADNRARAAGRRVRVVAVSARARGVLALSGLTARLDVPDAT